MTHQQSGGYQYHKTVYHKTYYGGARRSVDGHLCQNGWQARVNGQRLVCHTYCCYTRNRYTGRRSYASYCRVFEYGRQVLKQCARRYTAVSEAEDDDAESEGGFETFTWFVAGTTAGCIAMVGAVVAWSKLQKRTVREQPLLA